MRLTSVLLAVLCVATLARGADDVTSSTPTATTSVLLKRLEESRMRDETDVSVQTEPSTTQAPPPKVPKPEMYSLRVTSRIEYRFANTLITSRLANPANTSQEIFFSVVLPETAFISKFLMEVGGKVYEAYVKEKEEAKQEYDQAVASGIGAAHIALSARDSNRFTVSVNIEPLAKVTFNLTYEELLTRRLGAYNHVINLDPGQIVREMKVDVFIKESRNITTLRVPELRSGNEVDANELTKANPLAKIVRTSTTEAHVSFSPTVEEQKALGRVKAMTEDDVEEGQQAKVTEGLGGQFVVQYDVNRDPQAGEVLVNNGYFVHFFAPDDLPPLNKHALFVLDVSGSMEGRKIEQLKEAMDAILDDLNEGDYFNIIEFSYSVTVWNLDNTAASAVFSPYAYNYDAPAPNHAPTPAFPATPEYVAKAKEIVKKMRAGGGTNIYDTLKTVIRVAHSGLENITSNSTLNTTTPSSTPLNNTTSTNTTPSPTPRNPIIVFLTDGEPTVGETRLSKIFTLADELNTNPEAAIFSLAFGDDADLGFLKKLSLKNSGFARKIYEASDAALQLRDFYRQIASPLLANVTFNYLPDKVESDVTTKHSFHTLFSGSELVVAGKLRTNPNTASYYNTLDGDITGVSSKGPANIFLPTLIDVVLEPPTVAKDASSLERLWAYLTIKQLLEKDEVKKEEEEDRKKPAGGESGMNVTLTPKQEALELALKYSFVTPLTSLVVVKPNETKANETKASGSETVDPVDGDTGNKYAGFSGSFGPVDRLGGSSVSLPLSGYQLQSLSQPASSSFAAWPASAQAAAPSPVGAAGPPGPPQLAFERPTYQSTTSSAMGGSGGSGHRVSVVLPPGSPAHAALFEPDHEEDYDAGPAPTPAYALVEMNALSWLPAVRTGDDVTLPFGDNVTNAVYHLQLGEVNGTFTPRDCVTKQGTIGMCLHLQNCSLNVFQDDVNLYLDYFCYIDSFAGACCPEEITNKNQKSTTESASATTQSSTVHDVTELSKTSQAMTSSSSTTHDVTELSKTSQAMTSSSTVHDDVTNQAITSSSSSSSSSPAHDDVVTDTSKSGDITTPSPVASSLVTESTPASGAASETPQAA